MIYVSYSKIPDYANTQLLFERVKSSFGHCENSAYLGEIMSRKNEQSKRESLCALLILSSLVKRAELDSTNLILKRSPDGKPCFLDASLHFSLTHSNGYAAAAFSDKYRVGLDLECSEIDREKAKKLAVRWLNEDEAAAFLDGSEGFARIWTKKEAYAKMKDIPLSKLISNTKAFGVCQDAYYSYFEADRYPLTLCASSNNDEITFFETKL